MRSVAHEHGIAFFEICATIMMGWCLCQMGERERGWPQLSGGVAAYRSSGCMLYVPSFLRFEAEALAMLGRHDDALKRVAEAQAAARETAARWDEPEIVRLRGELLAATGDYAGARTAFVDAIHESRSCGARLFELRAAMGLAELELEGGDPGSGREFFLTVHPLVRGGSGSVDLDRARALAERLAPTAPQRSGAPLGGGFSA